MDIQQGYKKLQSHVAYSQAIGKYFVLYSPKWYDCIKIYQTITYIQYILS